MNTSATSKSSKKPAAIKPLPVIPKAKSAPIAPAAGLDSPATQEFLHAAGPGLPDGPASPSSPAVGGEDLRGHELYPWEGKSDSYMKQYVLRMPERAHAMLEWLGSTTYKASMHSIAIDAVCNEIERLMKDRGIIVELVRPKTRK